MARRWNCCAPGRSRVPTQHGTRRSPNQQPGAARSSTSARPCARGSDGRSARTDRTTRARARNTRTRPTRRTGSAATTQRRGQDGESSGTKYRSQPCQFDRMDPVLVGRTVLKWLRVACTYLKPSSHFKVKCSINPPATPRADLGTAGTEDAASGHTRWLRARPMRRRLRRAGVARAGERGEAGVKRARRSRQR